MIILFEKENVRNVYFLKENVILESIKEDDKYLVSMHNLEDREIFSKQRIGIAGEEGIKLISDGDAYAVYKINLWLNWMNYGEILETVDRDKKLKYDSLI